MREVNSLFLFKNSFLLQTIVGSIFMNNIQYMEVPSNVLTGKDLDYLSDMFQWNYGAYKQMKNSVGQVTDQEIVTVMDKAAGVFDQNLNTVLSILGGAGVE